MAQIIDGKKIAEEILQECKISTEKYFQKFQKNPGLVTLLIGNHPASLSYVSLKIKKAKYLGYHEVQENLPEEISEQKLLQKIEFYNQQKNIDGILVQLPLPAHINSEKVIHAISPQKDIDGFHPVNLGKMLINIDNADFLPCTPAGIREILSRSNISVGGKHVLVIGRSNIVGKPIANMLLQKSDHSSSNATVTIAHSATKDLEVFCKMADIIIVAAGVPNLIKSQWLSSKTVIIDVGVNKVGEKKKNGRTIPLLKGDVDFDSAKEIIQAITPVPGGVGPMTIAMLMKNTLHSFERRIKK